MTFAAVEYERPVSQTARAARWASLLALLIAVSAWAALRFGPLLQPHFVALYAAACVLALAGILGGFVGLFSLWRVGAKGGRAAVAAIFIALPVLAPGAYAGWLYQKRPLLYEVSTDIADPPGWIRTPFHDQLWLGARPPADEAIREQQATAYPALIGHRYEGALDRVLAGARAAAGDLHVKIRFEQLPKEAVSVPAPAPSGTIPIPTLRPEGYNPDLPPPPPPVAYLQGEMVGFVTGFRYDLVVRLREDGDTTIADIRVEARYGLSDLGGSARIAAAYMKALDDELAGGSQD